MYRRVWIKLAEFSTLSFTNSLLVNYFCQIADVSTTNRLARHRVQVYPLIICLLK